MCGGFEPIEAEGNEATTGHTAAKEGTGTTSNQQTWKHMAVTVIRDAKI